MSDWFRLPSLAGLRIAGADASSFAHAQFTSAFSDPEPGIWRLTAWCNPKGRVLAVILARTDENRVDLVVPAVQLAEFARNLKLYAIGRKLTFEETRVVSGSFRAEPGPNGLVVDPQRRLDLDRADNEACEQDIQRWRLCDLRSGIAWLKPQTSARFLPQSLGLEERGGLSYRKGCYPGQEIIARVHYLGKAKERLSAFRHPHSVKAQADSLVDDDGKTVGHVLDTVSDHGSTAGLAVIASELAAEARVHRGDQSVQLLLPESL